MRVLRVSAGLDPIHGGPPASTLASCLAAQGAGVNTVVLTIDEGQAGGRAAEALRAGGVEVAEYPLASWGKRIAYRWTVSPRLARALQERAWTSDVVHAHGAWTYTTVVSLLTARLRRLPIVLTPHEALTDFDLAKSGRVDRFVKHIMRSLYLRLFDAIVYASELEQSSTIHGQTRGRALVLPHPVEPAAADSTAPIRDGPLVVGFIGRFDPKKRLDVVLRDLPLDSYLRIAGDGPPEVHAHYRRVAAAAGLNDRVEWLGFVQNEAKRDFFASLDVLVMPSAYEGFGVAAAEAIAAGVPVIVSSQTGIASLVERYGCGAVVDPDGGGLRLELERVAFLRGAARHATRLALAELSPAAHGEALRQLYDELFAKRRRSWCA